MSDEAQQILQQMRKERAKTAAEIDPEYYYAKRRVFVGKRRLFIVILGMWFLIVNSMVWGNMTYDQHWMTLLTPIMILGGLLTLYPPTWEWVYTPWQSSTQKYERHFTE